MQVPAKAFLAEPPTREIEVSRLRITHVAEGEGQPVLLLHGWGANIGLMWALAARLIPLGCRVYLPDLPGFGASAQPLQVWSVYDYVNFVLAYMDNCGIERAAIIGHSFGGRLGLVLGAEHADRLTRLVLIDSAGVRPRLPLPVRLRTRAYKALRAGLQTLRLNKLAETLRERYNRRYGSADFQAVSGVMRDTFVRVVNEDLLPYAGRIRVPTLLLWGERDESTPLWQGRLLERTIPDAGLVSFPDAGHYSYLDNLPDTVRIIDHFLKY